MSSPQQPPPDPQAAQAGLAVMLRQILAVLFPQLDLSDLRAALPAFTAAIGLQVQRHAQASASLAARQYAQQRRAAGVRGAYTPTPAAPPALGQIAQAVDWAVQPLWSTSPAIADAKARLAASTERLVLDAGRDTIVGNAQRDPKAKGWARIPEPAACSFCLMLATRGAVYRSGSSADFKTHDNCRCHVEPVFNAYEPSAAVRQAQALWASSTRGKSGHAAQVAFRRAVEGRTAPTK